MHEVPIAGFLQYNERMDWDVAVIGAGMSGLSAAMQLERAGLRTVVLDKGRQVGGRMATRRMDGFALDTGAQFFTATTEAFRELLAVAQRDGVVTRWYERPARRASEGPLPVWRGASGMTDLPKWMAADLQASARIELHRSVRVLGVAPEGDGYVLTLDSGTRVLARGVILTAPVPQSIALLDGSLRARLPAGLGQVAYHPCLALLILLNRYPRDVLNDHGWVRPDNSVLAWIAENGTKGIATPEIREADGPAVALTVHATPEFSLRLYEEPDEPVLEAFVGALVAAMPGSAPTVMEAVDAGAWQIKRWRYAQPREIWGSHSVEVAPGVVLAGDVFVSPRVEGAFTSGRHAADRLVAAYGGTRETT